MAGWLKRFFASRRIPAEAYELIGRINRRYSDMDFCSGEYFGSSEKEKLALLIQKINFDPEIRRLNELSNIGSIIIFSQIRDTPSAGWGRNLCIGGNGLYIFDWNDYENKHKVIPLSLCVLEELGIELDCERLREAIVSYTSRDNYIRQVAGFDMFK